MEDRSNKTIICSVLFLDIVEYSKKAVTGQISLKDRFNTYLSEAIHDVPVSDRIILDTGDGAAVNFLGDIESALTAALRLRESLLGEDPDVDPELLVRIGINLGPVRVVRDINGQPNIVGDGINVAQRVMGFADPSQILVSRSYFDAVSRLSDQYTGMFHYQGSRTDKHVREHEIYAIGYPGDQTTKRMPVVKPAEHSSRLPASLTYGLRKFGRFLSTPGLVAERIKAADAKQRVLILAVIMVLSLTVFLLQSPKSHVAVKPVVETLQAVSSVPVVVAVAGGIKSAEVPSKAEPKNTPDKPKADKSSKDKPVSKSATLTQSKPDLAAVKKMVASEKAAEAQSKKSNASKSAAVANDNKAEPVKESYLNVMCKDEAQLFVDSANKGKVGAQGVTIVTTPGKHKIILTHPTKGIFTQDVSVDSGKTERIKPNVCN